MWYVQSYIREKNYKFDHLILKVKKLITEMKKNQIIQSCNLYLSHFIITKKYC